MKSVTAVEMQRHFGRIKEEAQREPIAITNHGRESLVLVSAAEFERLSALDTQQRVLVSELSDEALGHILDTSDIPEESRQAQRDHDAEINLP